jgi:ribonucleoside-diphosphate reductase alpha chain
MIVACEDRARAQRIPGLVIKRNGRQDSFDMHKIEHAVTRCLSNGVGLPEAVGKPIAHQVARAVCNILGQRNGHGETKAPAVEDIQDLVIQQLWALDHFEAAKQYTLYREERRKAREQRPIPPEVAQRVQEDQLHFASDLQYYQFMSKFSRWRESDKRRETWREAVFERVMPWLARQSLVRGKLSEQEYDELAKAMFDLEAHPAMRVLQMAGPALDRCNIGAFNCAFSPIGDLFALPEMLYILMQGTGHGFSCESSYVSELPRIKKQRTGVKETLVVPDDTEGWCDCYHRALQLWFDGYDCWFDVSGVRPKGAVLKTKGGRSSGSGPYLELMTFARNMILARQGRYLEDTDVHRLACFTGRIVQVGGVRRAAEISLSDLSSVGMRSLKSGAWWADNLFWENGKYLSMANNSAVYEEYPTVEVFMREMLALVESRAGERGIFNREGAISQRPARRKLARFGCNPCSEIILRPFELCNLSMCIARKDDTLETLKRKVRLATIFGVIQSTLTNFQYVREDWKINCEEERLLGVDITGQADCPLLRYGAPGRDQILADLLGVVRLTKKEFAQRFGINESTADTCVKPGGDSAVFFDCSSGISDRFADYQIRWVREPRSSPVARFLIDAGVPHAEAPEDKELLVFGFPREAPEGSTTRNAHTAVQQLEMWLETKKNWAEHSVAVTICVEPHEWPAVMAWCYQKEHWDHITGLSFLPRDNGTYTYPPNEELTHEAYDKFKAKFPHINWAKLPQYESEDMTTVTGTFACTNGACER